ncbi:hypothetical protein K470DRAFT_259552 [Piedraia hortae CBS 480.64]|uniref:DBF4-type domain-containing protein n=1 Tax=Piedraia hortae CBS 480.64 TaxID=1314780 RepID=A0A6A7BTI1_9PEZI|nr:hypothetical protein K470DRAFT_259552 [Piedraia hortae CBS 480.64]
MGSKRAPLLDVPHAVNSPLRTVAPVSGKRVRAAAEPLADQPPAKRPNVQQPGNGENLYPHDREEDPLGRRVNGQPNAFDRKLAAAKLASHQLKDKVPPRAQMDPHETARHNESIRQWQRHYRKEFPSFVIYFDNVTDDVRAKTVRQIHYLGAKEAKFFSKDVTHVVTTRQIPSEQLAGPDQHGQDGTLIPKQTMNPPPASYNVFDRTIQAQTVDVLTRARQLNMKIWALEKLHRMLHTILEGEVIDPTKARSQATSNRTRAAKEVDLEQLLRREKIKGQADRDWTASGQDRTALRGCYIYVHDMDEKTRPVMVRDYNKPAHKEQGKWPQLRLTAPGRCPFLEDPEHGKRIKQQMAEMQEAASRRTRGGQANATGAAALRPAAEPQVGLRRSPRKTSVSKPEPPKAPEASLAAPAELFGSAQQCLRVKPRLVRGEPVASGVQPSNITSAIKSHYVSSAAISSTAPGANFRVGDTKDLSLLKRKVLERGTNVTSNSIPSSYMNDVRAALNNANEPPPRAAKRRAQETLGVLPEGQEVQHQSKQRKVAGLRKAVRVERDPRPGYCENCREKFDDFDDVCIDVFVREIG